MANTFTAVVKQHWAGTIEDNLAKSLIARDLCTMVDIPNGTTKVLPRLDYQPTQDYVKNTDVTYSDIITASDSIVINTTPIVPFQIDRLDYDDNYLNLNPDLLSHAGYMLKKHIDWNVLAEAANAWNLYDNRWLNPSGWTVAPVALSTTYWNVWYINSVFGKAKALLINRWVNPAKICMVVDSEVILELGWLAMEKGFMLSDDSITRWYKWDFSWMKVYEATNLPASVTFAAPTTAPADWDTVTVNGSVFTYKTTLGTTAWNVLIWVSLATALTNLASAINWTSWAGTTYVAQADLTAMSGITAVAAATSVAITSKSWRMYPRSSMTTAANKFGAETISCLVMEKWAINLAMRDEVTIEKDRAPNKLVDLFKVYVRYWIKTTTLWARKMCRVDIVATIAA